jgi:hypothetical protein
MSEIEVFVNRLKKIGIEIELVGNIPWIYLERVNGNKIMIEDWINANHGYCVAWSGVRLGSEPHLNWPDIKHTFKIIRKYR